MPAKNTAGVSEAAPARPDLLLEPFVSGAMGLHHPILSCTDKLLHQIPCT
jgi:hypothetical protein